MWHPHLILIQRSCFPTHTTFTSPQRWILWTLFSTSSWNICSLSKKFMLTATLCITFCFDTLVGIFFVKRFYGFLWTTFQVNWLVLGCSCTPLRRGSDSDQKHKIQLCANRSIVQPVSFHLVTLHITIPCPWCVGMSSLHVYNSYPRGKCATNLRFWSWPKQMTLKDITCIFQKYPGPQMHPIIKNTEHQYTFDALGYAIIFYLGIFPKRRTPPPFWEPLVQNQNFWWFF